MMQEGKTTPVLFENKTNCCACGACTNACPKDAISMQEDEHGFIYPVVDSQKCIGCGRCKKVCSYQNDTETNQPLKTWAGVSRSSELITGAASGGIFSAIAEYFLHNNDLVSGAVFEDDFTLNHILTDRPDDLVRLRGSKYTQSSTGYVYRDIKKQLIAGKKVLFCGTPCQVAGLKAYLGRDYETLLTIDLICHGVPSNRMFKDYIHRFETKHDVKVNKFTFRDKTIGWGKNGSATASPGKKYKLFETAQSYFFLFAHSVIMRSNCYSCKYACSHRPGDLTIGDYWGIQKEHPEYLGNGKIDESKGVSVIIANTEKGTQFIQEHRDLFELYESTFEKAARGNAQLNAPTKHSSLREEYLKTYQQGGWKSLDETFCRRRGIKRYSGYIKSLIPVKLKRVLKRHLKQR